MARRAGIVLIEAVVGASLFALLALALLEGLGSSGVDARRSRLRLEAEALTEGTLAALRTLTDAELAGLGLTSGGPALAAPDRALLAPLPDLAPLVASADAMRGLHGARLMARLRQPLPGRLRGLEVELTWRDPRGRERSLRRATLERSAP
jgi:hypothetical protein